MTTKIPAIILAAGESKRMGFPKALLQVGRKTLLEDQIARLKKSGCSPIVVVVGSCVSFPRKRESSERSGIPAFAGMTYKYNHRWRLGQFSSIKSGLRALPATGRGCLILPVDVPFVPVKVIKKICTVAAEQAKPVLQSKLCNYAAIIPYCSNSGLTCPQTRRPTNPPTSKGHPIWVSDSLIKKIFRTPSKTGRLDLLLAKETKIHFLKTSSKAILNNFNTPADISQLKTF